MPAPLVSVVMVTCNVERFLDEAVRSILGQTLRDFEFIIGDFGSTDRTKEIAASHAAADARIKLIDIPPCPLPEARNRAWTIATGRYIAVMDADDIALPERLRLEVDFLENHPQVGVVGGATEWIDREGNVLRRDSFPETNQQIQAELENRCTFCHPTTLLRKEAIERVGGYRPIFTVAHDYDLWLRIAEHFECANLSSVVLQYRIHSQQVSMGKRRLQSLGILATQASAKSRRAGKLDPINSMTEITSTGLETMGVTAHQQESKLASELRQWIRHMRMAGEYPVALAAALDFLALPWKHVEKWQVADLWLSVSQIYWKQKQFSQSLGALGRAIVIRPVVMWRLRQRLAVQVD